MLIPRRVENLEPCQYHAANNALEKVSSVVQIQRGLGASKLAISSRIKIMT